MGFYARPVFDPNRWVRFLSANVFLAIISIVLHFGAELVNPSLYVPFTTICALFYLAIPFTHGMGGYLRYHTSWSFWQPFLGGAPFVALQALSWGFFAAALMQSFLLPCLASILEPHGWDMTWVPSSRGFTLSAGIAAFLSEVLMVSSLMTFRSAEYTKPDKTDKKEQPTPFSQTEAGHQWWMMFIALNFLLALLACFLTMVQTDNNFQSGLNVLLASWCLGAAVPLTNFLGGLWRHRENDWQAWQPFRGGHLFITLQASSWTLYAVSLLCAFVALYHYFHPVMFDPSLKELKNIAAANDFSLWAVMAGLTGLGSEMLMMGSLMSFEGKVMKRSRSSASDIARHDDDEDEEIVDGWSLLDEARKRLNLFLGLFLFVVFPPVVAFFLLLGFVAFMFFFSRRKEGPFLLGRIPYVGVGLEIFEDPKNSIVNLRAKYGDVFTGLYFGQSLTIIHDPKALKDVLTASEKVVSMQDGFEKTLGWFLPEGVLEQYSENVKLAIKNSTNERMEIHIGTMKRLCKALFEKLDKKVGKDGWGTINVFETFDELVLRIGMHSFCGDEFVHRFGEEFVELFEILDPERALAPGKGFGYLLSIIWKWPGGQSKVDKCFARMREMLSEIVKDRLASNRVENDFLQMALEHQMDIAEQAGRDRKDVNMQRIMTHVWAIMLASQTNSFATTSWIFNHAIHSPEFMRGVLEEQKQVLQDVPEHNVFNIKRADIDKMVYLQRGIREVVRLYTSGLAFRCLRKDLDVADYTIPAGRLIAVSANYLSKSNEQGWTGDPLKFDPDRWAEGREEQKRAICNGVVFGGGTHPCPGTRFAIYQVSTVVGCMLNNYDVELVSGGLEPDNHLGAIERAKDTVIMRYRRKPHP
eukprot:TRINITY_DN11510_c0_g1::TRINITY_DN11510_c0_g1_i1::g.10919::m.10919 TRINITY_DN11510_c0_g1::TRINITY_DN11510_c0_g1_i1::g.10919  ORF type:complete len:867 (-),score=282.12,sp/Q5RE72/CP51A_PONAB/23.28/4e-28,p450/PF00067.17/1.2e-47,Claudin_2/PF13903.1/0.97,Claudin_2/PF13903.1/3.2e+03,Claudin_2/PF13903.1/7.1e+02 TRINITY_DN11510_c0_g1_i1:460-3060(-)